MDYRHFLSEVRRRGGFATDEEAAAVVSTVLMAVSEVLPQGAVDGIVANLPPELWVFLRPSHREPDPHFDSQLFLGWVVSSFDVTGLRDKSVGGLDYYADYSGEEAIRRCQAVFAVLKSLLEKEQQDRLAAFLPGDVQAWFLEA